MFNTVGYIGNWLIVATDLWNWLIQQMDEYLYASHRFICLESCRLSQQRLLSQCILICICVWSCIWFMQHIDGYMTYIDKCMTYINGYVTYIDECMTYINGYVTYIDECMTYINGYMTYIICPFRGFLSWKLPAQPTGASLDRKGSPHTWNPVEEAASEEKETNARQGTFHMERPASCVAQNYSNLNLRMWLERNFVMVSLLCLCLWLFLFASGAGGGVKSVTFLGPPTQTVNI